MSGTQDYAGYQSPYTMAYVRMQSWCTNIFASLIGLCTVSMLLHMRHHPIP